jgi:hypothetical protein
MTPLQQVSTALAANEPKDAAEAQQRIWIVVQEPSSRQAGASMAPRIKRFTPPPPPVAWSPDKVGAMTYPEAQRKLFSLFTASTMPVAAPTGFTSFVSAAATSDDTGKTFLYRTSDGRGALYRLWKRKSAETRTTKTDGVKTTVQLPAFFWSERNPNPGAMHTKDMKFSDSYKPPGGNSVEEAQANAAAWAATNPGERPTTTTVVELPSAPPGEAEYAAPPPRRSRVPLLIAAGAVALLASIGIYAWRRK